MAADTSGKSDCLPPELVDYTIDFMHGDTKTLLACAVVARSWLQSTRYHLFRRIKLNCTDGLNLMSFCTFLKESPQVSSLIGELILAATGYQFVVCPEHVLPTILAYLPHLQSLHLWSCRAGMRLACACEPHDRALESAPLQAFDLHELVVTSVAHSSVKSLLRFMGLFGHVHSVEISEDHIEGLDDVQDLVWSGELLHPFGETETHETVNPWRLRVDEISISSLVIPVHWHALSASPTLESLHTLRLSVDTLLDMHAFINLVQRCPNVRNVDLFPMSIRGDPKWTSASLGSCPSLERFAIRLWNYDDIDTEDMLSAAFIAHEYQNVLSVLPNLVPHVPHVTIGVSPADFRFDSLRHQYSWDNMQTTLLRLTNLKSVTFEIPNHRAQDISLVKAFIVEKAGRLQERCPVTAVVAEQDWMRGILG